jgi:hypothetical protein
MSVARFAHTATLIPSSQLVLVAGGFGIDITYLSSAEYYSFSANTWTSTLGNMNSQHAEAVATLLADNVTVIVAGGLASGSSTNAVDLYNSVTHTWSSGTGMGVARALAAGVLLPNGGFLVTGGVNSGNVPVATCEIYNAISNTWTPTGSLPHPVSQHVAVLLSNGLQVLVTGGQQDTGEEQLTYLYTISTGTWGTTASLDYFPTQPTGTLLAFGDTVLVAGGYDSTVPATSSGAEIYNQGTASWSGAASMTSPRYESAAILLQDGLVLQTGGFTSGTSGGCTGSTELYSVPLNRWTASGTMNNARAFHTISISSNGVALVAGGQTGSGETAVTATAEIYTPCAPVPSLSPIAAPSISPSVVPTGLPSSQPTEVPPSGVPSASPSTTPSGIPTGAPSAAPAAPRFDWACLTICVGAALALHILS